MEVFILLFEIIGTVAFAISGAMIGIRKEMDIFGVTVLGVTTAVGGGVIRDLILGITPPQTFSNPLYFLIAAAVSVIVFLPFVRRFLFADRKFYDWFLSVSDAAGLGIFTVCGMKVAIDCGHGDNIFLLLFVSVVTGVGGGVMRDLFAGQRPFIFVKHIYACASLFGAGLAAAIHHFFGIYPAMIVGFLSIVAIRILSKTFEWSLPKAHFEEWEELK